MAREGNTRERVLRPRRPMAGEDLAHRAEQESRFPLHGGTRRDVSRDRLSPHELVETEEI
jgi:hypothetical protein